MSLLIGAQALKSTDTRNIPRTHVHFEVYIVDEETPIHEIQKKDGS